MDHYTFIKLIINFRNRVHRHQGDYYRGDKKGHFLTAQVVCDLQGSEIYAVDLGVGRSNYKAMYVQTGLKQFNNAQDLKMLADGGYSDKESLVVSDENKGSKWNMNQESLHSIAESVIGVIQCWGIANSKFRGSPELQEMCLLIVYELANRQLKNGL